MALKLICVVLSVVINILTVVNSSRVEKENHVPDITDITNNITSVQKLLEKMLSGYKKFDKTSNTDSVETDESPYSEQKIIKASNGGKLNRKVTTKSLAFKGTPIFFSDKSSTESDSDTEEEETSDVANINKNTHNTRKPHKEYPSSRIPINLVINNKPRAKASDEESESSEDEDPIKEKSKNDFLDKENHRDQGYIKTASHQVSKGKSIEIQGRASTTRQENDPLNKSKKTQLQIIKTNEEVHDSQSEEDKAMENEVLRAGHLRQAYVDACKQVIIRKCLRALRTVSKDVCSKGRKCQSSFKDDFRVNGQAACDEQFTNQTSACRMGVDLGEVADDNLESERTRQSKIKKPFEPAALKTPKQTNEIKEVNILRDRFETVCRKSSFQKCQIACKDASKKTCKKHECVTAKEKAMKNSCKRRCKESFQYSGGDSDESGDDADDDSDDEDDD